MTGTAIAAKAHKNKGETNVIEHKNTNLTLYHKLPLASFKKDIQEYPGRISA